MEKVPYMLVLGDKEQEAGLVAVRSRKTGETETMTLDALMEKLQREVDKKRSNKKQSLKRRYSLSGEYRPAHGAFSAAAEYAAAAGMRRTVCPPQ